MSEIDPKNIQKALKTCFDTRITREGHIRISHGAQFSRVGAALSWFLMVFLILIVVALFINGYYLPAILLIVGCVLIAAYILDFQGAEFDMAHAKVRNYQSFLGVRSGEWHSLKELRNLKIIQESILEPRRMDGGTAGSPRRGHDTYFFYTLFLSGRDGKILIRLFEDENVVSVKQLATLFAEKAQLEFQPNPERRKPERIQF